MKTELKKIPGIEALMEVFEPDKLENKNQQENEIKIMKRRHSTVLPNMIKR